MEQQKQNPVYIKQLFDDLCHGETILDACRNV